MPPRPTTLQEEKLLRPLKGLLLVAAVTVVGALGYRIIEGWPWSDSLYMVFITLSTVGFEEVHDLSDLGRLWTVVILVCGVGAVGYTAAQVVEFLLEGYLLGFRRRRRMDRHIRGIRDHFIICGYGRVGRQVAADFMARGKPFVVIDRRDESGDLEREGIPHILGNAEQEATLKQAGIERAAGLVAAVDSDTENVFIILTARELNPDLHLIARSSDTDAAHKLKLVGAHRVVSPYVTSGKRMAQLALRPEAVDILDLIVDPLRELNVEIREVEIVAGGSFVGSNLRELDLRRRSGVIVVAMRREGQVAFNPDPDAVITAGTTLIVLGTEEQCSKLGALNEIDAPVPEPEEG